MDEYLSLIDDLARKAAHMKILKLTAENLKRIQVVEITPDGALVQITGRNGAGKSSVLDAITYAIGGKDTVCAEPLRKGEKRGKAVVDLGDIIVTRTFTEGGGGQLTVTSKDGTKQASPQAVLDKLCGRISLDPLAFSRMEPKAQATTLRNLAGLDFTKIDQARQAAYDGRTVANREVARLQAQLQSMTHHADAPANEVSGEAVLSEFQAAMSLSDEMARAGRDNHARRDLLGQISARQLQISRELDALFTEQGKLEEEVIEVQASIKATSSWIDAQPEFDLAGLKQKLSGLEATNHAVRENRRRLGVESDIRLAHADVAKTTDRIAALDAKKQEMLAAAKFPIDGLSFDDNGVLLNSIPFAQASAAEQLRTSVAIALAMNPKLKVVLIRDGSLLDSAGLKLIAEMAEAADAQVWCERVSDGAPVGVLIEDGCVAVATATA